MLNNTRIYKLAALIAINLGMVFLIGLWLSRNLEWSLLFQSIHRISLISVFFTLILGCVLLGAYARRLSAILETQFLTSFGITCLGHGSNNLLPFRTGEGFRKILLAKRIYKIPFANLFMASAIEKLLDLFSILLIGSILMLTKVIAIKNTYLFLLFFLIIAAGITLIFFQKFLIKTAWGAKLSNKIKVINKAWAFIDKLLIKGKVFEIAIYTILIWSITFLIFYNYFDLNLSGFSFHIVDAIALMFLTTITLGLPSIPASLGIFEAAIVFYLIKFHEINPTTAVSLAIFFHLLVTLPQIIFMLFTLLIKRKNCYKE